MLERIRGLESQVALACRPVKRVSVFHTMPADSGVFQPTSAGPCEALTSQFRVKRPFLPQSMRKAMRKILSRVHDDHALSPLCVQVEQPYAVGTVQGHSNGRMLLILQPSLGRQSGRNDDTRETYNTGERPSTRESVSEDRVHALDTVPESCRLKEGQ